MAQIIESVKPDESLYTLANRWSELREHARSRQTTALVDEGLPLRARRVIEEVGAGTVQDLLKVDPTELFERHNVGRSTLASLLARAEQCLPPVSVESSAPDFIAVVDTLLEPLPPRSQTIIIDRFHRRVRTIDVARTVAISRERVRQIEEKFVRLVRGSSRRYRLPLEQVLDDDVIEFDELSAGHYRPRHPESFYVAVARAVLGDGDSYVDVERYYSRQMDLVAREIQRDGAFVLGALGTQRVREMVEEIAPALSELPHDEVWRRLSAELRATDDGQRLVGRKPAVGRIIRALLRNADGPISLPALVHQLAGVLAIYGEVSYFDSIRLRNKLATMPDVHLLDQQTASLHLPDPGVAGEWLDRVVREIQAFGKPYFLGRFLEENEEAPFDSYALHSLLVKDARVVHVGRRLYAPAEYEADGPLRIAQLIEQALVEEGGPLTRRDLLHYIRERRDVKCAQIDHYFRRVRGLVQYTDDVVGIAPLDRVVMKQIMSKESTLASLLADRDEEGPVHISALWLLDDEPELSRAEEKEIVKAARRWKSVRAAVQAAGLFFEVRED